MSMHAYNDIRSYYAAQPKSVQAKLRALHAAVKKVAPKAEETISYGLPSFKQEGILLHYAGWKDSIALYPGPAALIAYRKELRKYPMTKGGVKFPLDKAVPLPLVMRIARFRLKANLEKAAAKKVKKTAKKKSAKRK